MEILKGEETGAERIFEEMAKNSSNLFKNINLETNSK